MNKPFTFAVVLVLSHAAVSQTSGHRTTSGTPAPKEGHIASLTSPQYLTEPFDPSVAEVGRNFKGHDIVTIAKKIANASELKPKSEFESSAEYDKRRGSFRSRILGGNVSTDSYLAFLVEDTSNFGGSFNYDADIKAMNAMLAGKQEKFYLEQDSPVRDTVTIRSQMLDRGKYMGRNAFGAKVEVTQTYSEDYGLSFDSTSWLFADSPETYQRRFVTLVPMSTEDARRNKANARLLVVCRLIEPWYRTSASGHDATIDSPYDRTVGLRFLEVHPEQVWLINQETGEVIRKFSEESAATDKAAQMALQLRKYPLIVDLASNDAAGGMVSVKVDDAQPEYQSLGNKTKRFTASREVGLVWTLPRDLKGLSVAVNGKAYIPKWQKDESGVEARAVISLPAVE